MQVSFRMAGFLLLVSLHGSLLSVSFVGLFRLFDISFLSLLSLLHSERWGAGVEYHFQEFNEPYAPS